MHNGAASSSTHLSNASSARPDQRISRPHSAVCSSSHISSTQLHTTQERQQKSSAQHGKKAARSTKTNACGRATIIKHGSSASQTVTAERVAGMSTAAASQASVTVPTRRGTQGRSGTARARWQQAASSRSDAASSRPRVRFSPEMSPSGAISCPFLENKSERFWISLTSCVFRSCRRYAYLRLTPRCPRRLSGTD